MVVAGRELERLAVPLKLRIGALAENDYRGVGLFRVAAVAAQSRSPAGGPHCALDAGVDRGRAGKILVMVMSALPVDGPTTALQPDVVRRIAGNEHVGAGIEGQDRMLVLQQDQ